MTGLLDRAMNYIAERFKAPLDASYDDADYAKLTATAGWTAPYTAIGWFRISPSSSAGAYAYLSDMTDNIYISQISSSGGLSMSTAVPIIKGHNYKVTGSSTNVQSGTRVLLRVYKLCGGGGQLNLTLRREAVAA